MRERDINKSNNRSKGVIKKIARFLIPLTIVAFMGCGPIASQIKEIVSETTDIKDGTWKYYELNATGKIRLGIAVTVSTGPAIDLITMTEEGYLAWKNAMTRILAGGEYYFYPELSAKSIRSVSKTGVLGPGKYVVVVYNPEYALLLENKATATVKIISQLAL